MLRREGLGRVAEEGVRVVAEERVHLRDALRGRRNVIVGNWKGHWGMATTRPREFRVRVCGSYERSASANSASAAATM